MPRRAGLMFDAMAQRFDDTMARARGHADILDRAAEELSGVQGHAEAAAGDARAVVDARGALVSLWLAETVARLPAEQIGALIVDTAHAAARDATSRRRRVLDDLLDDLGR